MYKPLLMKSEHHIASIDAIGSIKEDAMSFLNKLNELTECNIYEPELLEQITNILNSIDSKLNIFVFYLKNAKTECLNNISALSDNISTLISECLWINNNKDQALVTGFYTELRPLERLSYDSEDKDSRGILPLNRIEIVPINDESTYSFLSIWDFIRNVDDNEYESLFKVSKYKFDYMSEKIAELLTNIREETRPLLHSPHFIMNLSIPDKKDVVITECNNIIGKGRRIETVVDDFERVIKNIHDCEVALYENQDIFYEFYTYCEAHKSIAYAPESTITLI